MRFNLAVISGVNKSISIRSDAGMIRGEPAGYLEKKAIRGWLQRACGVSGY